MSKGDPSPDERLGLPSASGMGRLMLCPASFLREQRLKGVVGDGKACERAARRGEVIHNAVHKSKLEALKFSDRICAERLMFIEAQMVNKHSFEGAEVIREIRHWYYQDEKAIFSGKPDAVHLLGNRAMVINYKTGHYMPDLLPNNWQLICEAALVAWTYKVDEVVGVLIHPNCDKVSGKTSQDFIYQSSRLLSHSLPKLVMACREAVNPFVLGTPEPSACKFCLAKKGSQCEEYQEAKINLVGF